MKPRKDGIYCKYIKRLLDIICSLLTLIVFSWLYLLVAILVMIKLGRPVIFKQERVGKNNKVFTLYKFRTMTDKKDDSGRLLPDEIRLTKFGRLLRTSSIDELPEMVNILKGDMSIVGPRPLLTKYLSLYNETQKRRHEVLPGLTGLAMSTVRNSAGWDKKFELDVRYVNELSFALDIKIVLWTIMIVLLRKGINEQGFATNSEFKGSSGTINKPL